MANHALLVGIDNYSSQPLDTPVRDVDAIEPLLQYDADDEPRWEVEVLRGPRRSSSRVTEVALDAALTTMLESAAEEGGHVLFYFAGHGSQSLLDGHRLVLQGAKDSDPDVSVNLLGIVNRIHGHPDIKSATIILDCCYVGGVGNEPDFAIRKDRAILTSSRSGQPSVDGRRANSPFATFVLEALRGATAPLTGDVTLTGLFEYVSKRFGKKEQRPQLKINLASEPVVLRRSSRLINPGEILKLFPTVDARRVLGWEYEGPEYPDETIERCYCGGSRHHHGRPYHRYPNLERTAKQKEFDELKRLYSVGLIHTWEGQTPFVLIEESRDLWLSPLGQWYWHQRKLRWI